jgi:hypothetical protein
MEVTVQQQIPEKLERATSRCTRVPTRINQHHDFVEVSDVLGLFVGGAFARPLSLRGHDCARLYLTTEGWLFVAATWERCAGEGGDYHDPPPLTWTWVMLEEARESYGDGGDHGRFERAFTAARDAPGAERCAAAQAFARTMKRLARRADANGHDEPATWHFARVGLIRMTLGVPVGEHHVEIDIEKQAASARNHLASVRQHNVRVGALFELCKSTDSARRHAWLWSRAAEAAARFKARVAALGEEV